MNASTLNILLIINEDFLKAAYRVFNPAQAMLISKNDGYFNNDYNMQRDTVINSSTMMYLSREFYTEEQLKKIAAIKAMKPVSTGIVEK